MTLFEKLVFINLFDMHPPLTEKDHLIFQIDGICNIVYGNQIKSIVISKGECVRFT